MSAPAAGLDSSPLAAPSWASRPLKAQSLAALAEGPKAAESEAA